MQTPESDSAFTGSVPALYEQRMVPLIFQTYAEDLVDRLVPLAPMEVLEVAAGTGVVTREMGRRLPQTTSIVATDLNPAMLEMASGLGTSRPVEWRQADALSLPFPDGSFDAVVCQFGAMFFPDRSAGYAEFRRVLRPGGVLLFNVWDRIENNEFAAVVHDLVCTLFPDDPPVFMSRTPHGYFDEALIRSDLLAAGFARTDVTIEWVERRSTAASPRDPAVALCQGTPLRGELERRDPHCLASVTDQATQAIAQRFGDGPVEGKIRALVVQARS